MLQLRSREAQLSPDGCTRSLNFGGRVKRGSVKNFQMEQQPEQGPMEQVLGANGEPPLLFQFGRVAKDVFILDFRHPLSPAQAFALGITALARKIASEGR